MLKIWWMALNLLTPLFAYAKRGTAPGILAGGCGISCREAVVPEPPQPRGPGPPRGESVCPPDRSADGLPTLLCHTRRLASTLPEIRSEQRQTRAVIRALHEKEVCGTLGCKWGGFLSIQRPFETALNEGRDHRIILVYNT